MDSGGILAVGEATPKPVTKKLGQEITNSNDGSFVFNFNLPREGLALRSVGVVDGLPEFRFDASYAPNVPTISDEDIATLFRLAMEGKRPEFFYAGFPLTHPLNLSRLFKYYSPTWLRGTETGELLAEVDWTMKCLHIGTRTNKEKTVFKAWSKESQLDGLATHLDFPKGPDVGPTMMSCEHAKIQKGDNEIWFPEEPKMKITDGSKPLYSKYITSIYESVGYYDEPMFLKMQEIIKLILAVEWLYNEKGIRVNHDWMMERTSKPKKSMKADSHLELGYSPKLSTRKEVQPRVFKRPSSDVSVKTWEAEMYNALTTECNVQRRYGYYDFGNAEVVTFKEDGTPCQHQKCLKLGVVKQSIIGHQLVGGSTEWCFALPEAFEPTKFRDALLTELKRNSLKVITYPIPLSVKTTEEDLTDESGVEVKITHSFQPSPPLALPPVKKTTVLTATIDNYDKFCSGLDPNMPIYIQSEIPGVCEAITPGVESWDELFSELSVPLPRVWHVPFVGVGEPTAHGGVTTRDIRVEEEPLRTRVACNQLTVKAECHRVKGAIQWLSRKCTEFGEVCRKFTRKWIKGGCPSVLFIFAITNGTSERKWTRYGQVLQDVPEPYYHGTTLACDIKTTQELCTNGNCGICGISNDGFDLGRIRRKRDHFQRFGAGFYLAPNSSKSHDYADGVNGYRAMLLCDVHPGKKCKLETNRRYLKGPPPGYDSVFGIVTDNSDLNYPEIVVYDQDAIMPRYIIGYRF